ncbi:hypothetical protein Baya_13316 [Bagarius yarrelli]|uniref:Uncharacterized protein n=1 Tax=Bagarius yarrelli TaxID=175774 RepID=A0A556V5N5_BAGYA|nr:hypothetical protein Baya_13316 [Bagarius yarrelli]
MNHLAAKLPHGAPEVSQAVKKCGLGDAISRLSSFSVSLDVLFSRCGNLISYFSLNTAAQASHMCRNPIVPHGDEVEASEVEVKLLSADLMAEVVETILPSRVLAAGTRYTLDCPVGADLEFLQEHFTAVLSSRHPF